MDQHFYRETALKTAKIGLFSQKAGPIVLRNRPPPELRRRVSSL
jgi:hypothetical protein